jgi:putative oxidoreductase
MRKFIGKITGIYPTPDSFHWSLLIFRVLISLELMIAHGLKKIGMGGEQVESIPNPLQLPFVFNQVFAISANLFFPVLIIIGLFTRLAILPILIVTLVGYFVVHWNDLPLEKDMPFMYSVAFLLLFVLGPGKYSADYFINKRFRS